MFCTENAVSACSLYRLAGTAARRGALSCYTETHADIHIMFQRVKVGLNEPARGRCNATDCGGVEGASVCSRCSRIGLKVAGLSEIRAAGEEKWRTCSPRILVRCRCEKSCYLLPPIAT